MRGTYVRPETSWAAGNLIVIDWGSRTLRPSWPLCQYVARPAWSTERAGWPGLALDAVARHPRGRSAGANGIHAAFVGCSMCCIASAGTPLIPMEAGRLPAGTIASARPEHATTATIAATNAINNPPPILRPLTFATLVPRKSDHTSNAWSASEF